MNHHELEQHSNSETFWTKTELQQIPAISNRNLFP